MPVAAWVKRESCERQNDAASVNGRGVAPRSYSLLYASRGANVVVNDFNKDAAQKVVDEITKGAKAERRRREAADY